MTEIPQDNTVLIAGAGGRLGTLLTRAALRDGCGGKRVLFQSRRPGRDIVWTPGDPPGALPGCGTLVALWGVTSGTVDELRANVDLVRTGLAVARACGARRVLHLSSAAIYGPGRALDEDAHPAPAGAYGQSKLQMEQAIAALPENEEPRHCALRLANVVGADSLAPALRRDTPVRLDRFPGGHGPRRSYIAASDLLRVLLGLADLDPAHLPARLNVAAPSTFDMADLARAAGRRIDWQDAPDSAVPEVALDVRRLQRLLPAIAFLSTARDLVRDWQELETAI